MRVLLIVLAPINRRVVHASHWLVNMHFYRWPLYARSIKSSQNRKNAVVVYLRQTNGIVPDRIFELVKFKHMKLLNSKTDFQIADLFVEAATTTDMWRSLLGVAMIYPC